MANDLSSFNSEAWSARLCTKVDQKNVMLPLVNRNWEGDLRLNKTVWVRTPGNISMSSYTRGTTIVYQDVTPTKEAFTVNDGEYLAFDVDDIDKAQSDISAMDVYLKRAVVAMNNTVEAKILAAYSSAGAILGATPVATTQPVFTPVIGTGTLAGQIASITITSPGTGVTVAPLIYFYGGNGNGAAATVAVSGGTVATVTVTAPGNNYTIAPMIGLTSATAITLDSTTTAMVGIYQVFVKARTILSNNNVPSEIGARWAVISPDHTSLLLQDTNHFIRAGELGDKVVQNALIGGEEVVRTAAEAPGFIGTMAGFMVYETPHVPARTTTPYMLFGDNEAISYAAQITQIEILRLQTTFANACRALLLHETFVAAEAGKRLVAIKTAVPA